MVDGFKAGACGDACKFNAEEAKALYAKSGGYKGGPLTITVNADGGHKPWADAACNSIKNTLGLDCVTKTTPDFKTLRDQVNKREIKGLFRSGWQMDYPSIENFLAPIYGTGAGSNDTAYSNTEFDAKLAAGRRGSDAGRGERAVPGGRGHSGHGLPDHADVELLPDRSAGLIG